MMRFLINHNFKIKRWMILGLIFIVLMSSSYAFCEAPDIDKYHDCELKCKTGYVVNQDCLSICNNDFWGKQSDYDICMKDELQKKTATTKTADEITILDKRGEVMIKQSDGVWREMPAQVFLKDGDMIKTGRGSSVSIILPDGTEIRLAPNSEFTYEAKEVSAGVFMINLISGKMRAFHKWTDRMKRKFEVRTPTAVTSVRGTDFIVDYNTEKNMTTIYLYEGIVDVNTTARGEVFELNAGEMMTVDSKGNVVKTELDANMWAGLVNEISAENIISLYKEKTNKVWKILNYFSVVLTIIILIWILVRKKNFRQLK